MIYYPVFEKGTQPRVVGYQERISGFRRYLNIQHTDNILVVPTRYDINNPLQKIKCTELLSGDFLCYSGEIHLIVKQSQRSYNTVKLFSETSIANFVMYIYDTNEIWSISRTPKLRVKK